MAITTEMIKQLREATGAGILDCRKALEQADGDFEKAVDFLREKGLAKAAKRADRAASEGVVELYSHGNGRVGVMVEVNCETDFVAREESFRSFAHELALQIAASAPAYVQEEDIPAEVIEREDRPSPPPAPAKRASPKRSSRASSKATLKKFKDEAVLMRQTYIRDESMTIQELFNQTGRRARRKYRHPALRPLGVRRRHPTD